MNTRKTDGVKFKSQLCFSLAVCECGMAPLPRRVVVKVQGVGQGVLTVGSPAGACVFIIVGFSIFP